MSRYAPALIQIAIALVGAASQLTGHLTTVTALQLAILGVNAVVVYLVPLFGPNARSGWKTGTAIFFALVSAALPYIAGHAITGPQVALVVLAGLQALGAHIGVQIRNDATTTAATPTVTPAAAPAPLPTETTVLNAVKNNGGEFLGEPAR